MSQTNQTPPDAVPREILEQRMDNIDLVEYHMYKYRHLRELFDCINRDNKPRYFLWQSYLLDEMAKSLIEIEKYPDISAMMCKDILKDKMYGYVKMRAGVLHMRKENNDERNFR